MFQFLGKKSGAMLGVDIGSTTIKIIELGLRGNQYSVESYAVEALPPESVVEKEIRNIDAVGEAIEKAVRRANTSVKHAAVAVPSSTVMTKVVQFSANLGEEELVEIVEMEAGRHIPYPPSEVSLDFEVLGLNEKDPESIDVLLVASRSENVENRIVALELAGLKVKVVDVDVYTLERAVTLFTDEETERNSDIIAVVDIGATLTTFNVIHDGKIIYTRDEVFGGKQLCDEVQRRYEKNFSEALAIIRDNSLGEEYEKEVLAPFREAAVQQINRALQFFISSTDYRHVDQIILAGGTASAAGLVPELKEKIGIENIQVANPFEDMKIQSKIRKIDLEQDASALLTACGLAMRSFV